MLTYLAWDGVFGNGQSLEAAKRVEPKCALFVGMVHEFEDESDNAALAEWSKKYQSISFMHYFSV